MQFVGQQAVRPVVLDFGYFELAGGQIHRRQSGAFPPDVDGGEVMGAFRVEQVILQHCSRGDDAHHLPFHQSLGQFRVFHLFADGDLFALLDQFGNVLVGCMMRDAAHGNGIGLVLVA